MAEDLSYVMVTPYSIRKSRTGGIIARLISRTGLDLVRAMMFAPSKELVEAYAESIITDPEPRHRATQELIRQYVLNNFAPDRQGRRQRVLFLVFRGPDALMKIRTTVGHIVNERTSGETIRDTFGDYIVDPDGTGPLFRAGRSRAPRRDFRRDEPETLGLVFGLRWRPARGRDAISSRRARSKNTGAH